MYVSKGSPPGIDVKNAVDYLQSFNSGWPLLKQHTTGNFSGNVSHNLGYFPFYTMVSTFTPSAFDQFAGMSGSYGVSQTQLTRNSGSGNPRYYIFRLDLETNFTAQTIDGSTSTSSISNDYVFKLVKEGADVDSTDMRDFSLHSNTRSPMVHKVDYGGVSGGGLGRSRTINHGLNYLPTAFAFVKPGTGSTAPGMTNGMYYIVPPPVGVSGGYYEVSSTQVYATLDSFYFSASTVISFVVLKDPFDKNVINRNYP